MNCPSCGSPLLFGAGDCNCGYRRASAERSSIELTYWEALRAYWRIYWPSQLFGLAGYFALVFLRVPVLTPVAQVLLPVVLVAMGLFLYVHRILSSSFREFSIYAITDTPQAATVKFKLRRRTQVWFFLWWRQLVAGVLAVILAAPTNILLSLIGLQAIFGINVAFVVSTFGAVLAIGPILLKMLIGHQFSNFRLEVQRFSARTEATSPPL